MNVVFRCDASLQMGSGHVMRCLTLADTLKAHGVYCSFLCREHQGNLIEFIRERGYSVIALPAGAENFQPTIDSAETALNHAAWLGCHWQSDAEQCRSTLESIQPDWLVVDHYALDARWHVALKGTYHKLMVIDDLADRQHLCDLLLDQNLGRKAEDYAGLIPLGCDICIGPQYALLRPEFAILREYSLERRKEPMLRNILISMGGVDQYNATDEVLTALKKCSLPIDIHLTVVMGAHAPWIADIQAKARLMPWRTNVLVSADNMAQLMADSDLAIGAAGSTSWERCCLGLPSVLVCLASNQRQALEALEEVGAVKAMALESILSDLPSYLSSPTLISALHTMSISARKVVDGCGAYKVSNFLGE